MSVLFRLLPYIALTAMLTGCVTSNTAQNWKPDTRDRDSGFYQCLQNAQQGYSTGSFAASSALAGGNYQSGAKTNCELMNSCMRMKGYRKRDESAIEMTSDFLLSPIHALAMMGGQCYVF